MNIEAVFSGTLERAEILVAQLQKLASVRGVRLGRTQVCIDRQIQVHLRFEGVGQDRLPKTADRTYMVKNDWETR